MKLSREYYLQDDVVAVSRDLLGKVLCSELDGVLTSAAITETEAYAGVTDQASHAYGGRRTRRTEPMFAEGGIAYVYLCYGMHHLFNVVTGEAGTPHAILIRAGKPLSGIAAMLRRRDKPAVDHSLLAGPGSLARAMGITTGDTGASLTSGRIWIEDRGIDIDDDSVTIGPRVGVDYAGDDALRPYRFRGLGQSERSGQQITALPATRTEGNFPKERYPCRELTIAAGMPLPRSCQTCHLSGISTRSGCGTQSTSRHHTPTISRILARILPPVPVNIGTY